MQRNLLLLAAAGALFTQAALAATGQAPASPAPAMECSFQPPRPILLPKAYSGQTLKRQSGNRLIETAQLQNGVRIEIRQSGCVDFLTTEYTLIASPGQRLQRDQNGWIELARSAIAGLKIQPAAGGSADLNDFLSRAHGQRLQGGVFGACKDGSTAHPGECSWESTGGFMFSLKRSAHGTRVSATEYVSG